MAAYVLYTISELTFSLFRTNTTVGQCIEEPAAGDVASDTVSDRAGDVAGDAAGDATN